MHFFRLFFFVTLIAGTLFLPAQQYITVTPDHPTPEDSVTVIFDASAGSKGLEDCNCEVYLHSGLYVGNLDSVGELRYLAGEWGTADPKLKMESLGDNKYRFRFHFRSFYGLPEGEGYLQMSFLFRNADGSHQGMTLERQAVQVPSLTYLANRALDDAHGKEGAFLGRLQEVQYDRQGGMHFQAEGGTVDVHFLEGDVVKVTYLPPGQKLLLPTEAVVAQPITKMVIPNEEAGQIRYELGEGYTLEVQRDPLRLRFKQGDKLLMQDVDGFFQDAKNKTLGVRFALQEKEKIYGTGSRALPADRRGYRFPCFHSAVYGYTSGEPMLNMSIPFYVSSAGYGLYLDNARRAYFDIGKSESGVLEFGAKDDRGLTYYFIPASSPENILARYTYLTGRQPLPPRWALGYIQSRYGYKSQQEALGVVDTLLKAGFPLDALVLDYYWYGEKDVMGNFAWDRMNWPYPEQMMMSLADRGVQTVAISQPYVVQNSLQYSWLDSLGYFAKNKNGGSYVIADFWAGPASLLDVFNPDVQDWLWDKYDRLLRGGLGGLWVDLAEPENHPQGMLHVNGPSEEVHNLYPQVWNRFMYERFKQRYPEKRLFNLSRSGFAGTQRYSTFPWSGDVSRSWEALAIQPAIMLSMGLTGIGYMHSDLGGFAGGEKDPDLYTRWMQFGTFNPVMRAHGANVPSEPIHFDPVTQNRVREAIHLRYRLLPYTYTLAWQNSMTGTPLARPLFYQYPEDEAAYLIDDQYLWGQDLMVAPVLHPESQSKDSVYLPEGPWVDFFNDQSVWEGGEKIEVALTPEHIPVFVRGGAILPMQVSPRQAGAFFPDSLEFHYYPDLRVAASSAQLYLDDGKSSDSYASGSYLHLNVKAQAEKSALSWELTASGRSFIGMPDRSEFFLVFHGVGGKVKKANWLADNIVRVGSYEKMRTQTASFFHDQEHNRLYLHVTWMGGPADLLIAGKGLLNP